MEIGIISSDFELKSGNNVSIRKTQKAKHTHISGYASVFGKIDKLNDIIKKGSFKNTIKNPSEIKLLWQHNTSQPIGIITKLYEDDHGLKMEAEINNNVSAGFEASELIKQKAIQGLSIGYQVKKSEFSETGQRIITEINLLEISIVTFPANSKATICHVKNDQLNDGMLIQGDLVSEIETIDRIEKKSNNLEPQIISQSDTYIYNTDEYELKSAFTDYLRSGNKKEILKKYLGEAANEIVVLPSMHKNIMNNLSNKSVMRSIAAIEKISSSALDLIIEDGMFNSGWVGHENDRDETDTSKIKKKQIFVHEIYAQPKISQRLLDDSAVDLEAWVVERVSDSFIRLENESFFTGDGDKKPFGILKNQDIPVIKSDGNKITPELLLKMIHDLDESFLANATFIMHPTTLSTVQALKSNDGRFVWQHSLSDALKQTIFGIPVICSYHMPAMDQGELIIAIGDFKSGYKIVDRAGDNMMRDPYTEKPFVKFYVTKRVGGDVINPDAIRFAKFAA